LAPRAKESVPRFVLSSRVYYSQRDKRWAAEPIGGSGKPLKAVGCAVCCLSMALAQHGIERTPAELNRALKAAEGYSSKGWIRWAALEPATDGQSRAEILWHPTNHEIEACLAAGNPVLVKVAPPPMIQHWVLLVGRDGQDYLMKDPLDETKTVKPLSSLASDILAARVVKKDG
jgi:ABC-type bacteriocin/lantibiotic exporter with double-glycine peptidase domain